MTLVLMPSSNPFRMQNADMLSMTMSLLRMVESKTSFYLSHGALEVSDFCTQRPNILTKSILAADTNTKMLYTTERPKVAAFINGAFDVNAASVGEIKEYLGMDAGSDEDIAADDDDWLSD